MKPARKGAFRLARGKALAGWVAAARGALLPPPGVDAAACNAVVVAVIEGLAILGPIGMVRDDPATFARLEGIPGGLTRSLNAGAA